MLEWMMEKEKMRNGAKEVFLNIRRFTDYKYVEF